MNDIFAACGNVPVFRERLSSLVITGVIVTAVVAFRAIRVIKSVDAQSSSQSLRLLETDQAHHSSSCGHGAKEDG